MPLEPRELGGLRRSAARVAFLVVAASTYGTRRCFLEESNETQIILEAVAESSTELRETTAKIKAELDAMLDAARHEIIEDGMRNAVTERLPDLVARDFRAIIPGLVSGIEAGRITPVVGAEVLKELGRLRNAASHASRRWVLEHALGLSSPFIRDGAGLGLARLGDPNALPLLQRAVENEPNAQTRADLQLVVNELSEKMSDGLPAADRD
jgi:hypothetical protein